MIFKCQARKKHRFDALAGADEVGQFRQLPSRSEKFEKEENKILLTKAHLLPRNSFRSSHSFLQ